MLIRAISVENPYHRHQQTSLCQRLSETSFHLPRTTRCATLTHMLGYRMSIFCHIIKKKNTLEILSLLSLLLCHRAAVIYAFNAGGRIIFLLFFIFFIFLLVCFLHLKLSEILFYLSSYCSALQVIADTMARISSKTLADVCLSGLL